MSRHALAESVRPTTVIVPFPAGGTTDRVVRVLARRVSAQTGLPFIVDNKPGGSTLIAAMALMRAKADGYTIGIVPMSLNRLRALGRTGIDAARDFGFIARAVGQTHGLISRADSAFANVGDVVSHARNQPDAVTFATSGVASITHVAMEDFADRAGIRLRHIPFKGGTESLLALRSGVVDLVAESPLWMPDVDSGKCRLLAIWNDERASRYPSVPTMKELGYPVQLHSAIGLGTPIGVPPPALARLRLVFRQAILSDEFKAECQELLAPVMYLDGDDFQRFARENLIHEVAVVRRLGSRLTD